MQIRDNEDLEHKLRGIRTMLSIISEAPQGFSDFEWALSILEEVLDDCISYVENGRNEK